MKDVEKRFYATDIAVDDQVDRLAIAVTSSDEDTNIVSDSDGGSTYDERTDSASGGHEASWNFIVIMFCRLRLKFRLKIKKISTKNTKKTTQPKNTLQKKTHTQK